MLLRYIKRDPYVTFIVLGFKYMTFMCSVHGTLYTVILHCIALHGIHMLSAAICLMVNQKRAIQEAAVLETANQQLAIHEVAILKTANGIWRSMKQQS